MSPAQNINSHKVEEPKIVRTSLATKLDFNVLHSVFLALIFFSLERQDDLKLNPSSS